MGAWMRQREDVRFADRASAGRALGRALVQRGVRAAVVLGLTRGGVPVAYEVAQALSAPLDIVAVKKLRAPESEELAIGAVCADGTMFVREDVASELGVTDAYLARETQERLAAAQGAEQRCRGGHPPLEVSGGTVVVVDDGIATGATMEAAVRSVRRHGAARIIVAAPVSSQEAWAALRASADDVVCLATPRDFWAVGQFYDEFPQVTDEEVRRLVDLSRPAATKAGSHEQPGT